MKFATALKCSALATTLLLGACAHSIDDYKDVHEAEAAPVARDYHLVMYPGLPGVPGSHAAIWTPVQYHQVQYLYAHGCWESLAPQLAGTDWKSISKEGAEQLLANAIASPLSILPFSHAANTLGKYVESGAGGGLPGGLKYGSTLHSQAVKGDTGQCMSWMVYFAQANDGQLQGIGVVTDYDSVDGNPIPMPKEPDLLPTPEEVAKIKEMESRKAPPMLGH